MSSLSILTPQQYVTGTDVLADAGKYIRNWGKRTFILAGKKSAEAAGQAFFQSLVGNGIDYTLIIHTGYPTREAIERYASETARYGADIVVGIGGGRILDLSKAVGEKSGLPVVTLPTVAATCAAWSALSVLYDEQGAAAGGLSLKRPPVLSIVDLRVLAKSPVRYLKAGIADTLVKWYETFPALAAHGSDVQLRLKVKISELALDVLYESTEKAVEEVEHGEPGKALTDAVDAIVLLAGLVGSFRSEVFGNAGFAHPFYNGSTFVPGTRSQLHGEKVGFGLIVQLVLEKKSRDEIEKVVSFLASLELPVTLAQIGIDDAAEEVGVIADRIEKGLTERHIRKSRPSREELARAIYLADEIGRAFSDPAEKAVAL